MARFHNLKAEFLRICAGTDWKQSLEIHFGAGVAANEAVSPLLSLLPRAGFTWQAAYGLGLAVSQMAMRAMEPARIVMRRLMWNMNEESGNLGWGIPEAMGCILAKSGALAGEYGRILISYSYDIGRQDNFVEYAPLRRGVYWGIGHLAASNADAALPALPHLVAALGDEDAGVRIMASFAIRQLAGNLAGKEKTAKETAAQWRAAAAALEETANRPGAGAVTAEIFDGQAIVPVSLSAMAARALHALRE